MKRKGNGRMSRTWTSPCGFLIVGSCGDVELVYQIKSHVLFKEVGRLSSI